MTRGFICAVVYALFCCIPGSISASAVSEVETIDFMHADVDESTDARIDEDGFTVGLGEIEIIGSRVPLAEVQAPRMVTLMTQEGLEARRMLSGMESLASASSSDLAMACSSR